MSRYLAVACVIACSSPPAPVAKPAPPNDTTPDQKPIVTPPPKSDDPYLWLEDVESDKALQWARDRNATSKGELEAVPTFAASRDRVRAILDSKDKIPYVTRRGAYYYNFWTDAQHKKGLLRRTSLAEYKKKDPKWETVIDIDALDEQEKTSWVFEGTDCLYPKYERCLMSLSRGGGDSIVVREFDMVKKAFVDGGFVLPEAKSSTGWKDQDTIYVGTDFGPGSLTSSGYPRIAKEWKRGTKLADAKTIAEGQASDVAISASREWVDGQPVDWVQRNPTFFTNETKLITPGGLTLVETPADADIKTWHDQLVIQLRSDWKLGDKTWRKGSLLAIKRTDFLAGKRDLALLFEPTASSSLSDVAMFKSSVVINVLEDVKSRLYVVKRAGATWTKKPFGSAPSDTALLTPVDNYTTSDDYWLRTTDFVTPSTLTLGTVGGSSTKLKQSPAFYDAKGLEITQHFATSKDGTRVPYFQVARKGLALDGTNPTLLEGYGGFEVSQISYYSPITGAMWLERGGVYVSANIRGGGEYGPAWHQAALTHNRQRAYDDFIAIAEDLIARKVTSTPKLGITGASNGGLLMGVMLTERPDLFGAIVCSVPLLDMKRYHKLLAGASWMEEYGNPDDAADWAALAKFSPYHNVHAGTKYPRTLFTSSTRDDRVHPGHARKMVARMLEQKHDVLYYENIEGGHGGAADNEQAAFMQAMIWTFLTKQLGLK